MKTKGIGPQGIGVGSPFKKKGPCGGPNQPSCKDELKRMAAEQGFNKSYQNSMNVSNVGNMKQPARLKGGSFMSPGNVNRAATAETKKRIKNITSHSGYQALTKKEASNLISIGEKYTNSTNIVKDISLVDKAKVAYFGAKIASDYPNMFSYGKRRMK